MKIRVPLYWERASINVSMLAMSKWVVGSSNSRKFGGSSNSFAMVRRLFSPPLKIPTFLNTSSSEKRKHPSNVLTDSSVTLARVLSISSKTVRLVSSTSILCWAKYPLCTLCPNSRSPLLNSRTPARIFSRVDFPAPLGPTSTIRLPFSISRFRDR